MILGGRQEELMQAREVLELSLAMTRASSRAALSAELMAL
jgi:hypothetical protein